MEKTAFSFIAILTLGHLTYADGNIAPVEPVIKTPVVDNTNIWKNELTVYGWFPGISANTPFSNSGDKIDASDIIDNLNMVFMGRYKAKYSKWSIIGDLIYLDLGDSKSHTFQDGLVATARMDIKTLLINAGVGYNLIDTDNGSLNVVGGVRYLDLKVDVSTDLFVNRNLSASKDFADFFIGARGYKNINENWYIPYEADIGTGDSRLSWQLFAGVGYRYDWGDIKFGYRYIEYDMKDDAIVEDLSLSGAALGISIKF